MSTYGFPDGQELTQWLGQPLEQQTGKVIGAGSYIAGPFALANFASVVVALKAIGGNVTVKVTQKVAGGPASLQLQETVLVASGATLFQAFVLFGDSITVEFDGTVGGTSVDYAIYPSNTTTNAQVITQATINVQHNGLLVAAEPTVDFVDDAYAPFTVTDDAPNTRVLVTPARPAWVPVCDVTLAAIAAVIDTNTILGGNIPQTFRHLRFELVAQGDNAAVAVNVGLRVNNDALADYDYAKSRNANGAGSNPAGVGATSIDLGAMVTAGAGSYPSSWSYFVGDIGDYTNTRGWKMVNFESQDTNQNQVDSGGGTWRGTPAVTRLQLVPAAGNFNAGTRFTLYGLT